MIYFIIFFLTIGYFIFLLFSFAKLNNSDKTFCVYTHFHFSRFIFLRINFEKANNCDKNINISFSSTYVASNFFPNGLYQFTLTSNVW